MLDWVESDSKKIEMHHISGLEQMNQIEKEKLKPLSCRQVYKSSWIDFNNIFFHVTLCQGNFTSPSWETGSLTAFSGFDSWNEIATWQCLNGWKKVDGPILIRIPIKIQKGWVEHPQVRDIHKIWDKDLLNAKTLGMFVIVNSLLYQRSSGKFKLFLYIKLPKRNHLQIILFKS